MSGQQGIRGKHKVQAGRDINIAGRDQIFADQVVIATASAAELTVPEMLPRDMPGFTGREAELERLSGLAAGGSVVVTAIGGTAGVGKTALAIHAAHRLLPQFPDGHLYVDLRGYTAGQAPADPGEVLEVFLRHLGVPGEEVPVSVEERSGLLRQLLAARRVLMVLDNAATETQVRPLLPGAGGSLVIVTSRSVLSGLEVDDRIDLDVLSEDEAARLLARLTGPGRATADPAAVTELAGLCGRLPLALRIAGQLLAAHPTWPVVRLVEMLAGEQDRLTRLTAGDLRVRAAFEVSYAQLAGEDARMFRLLGLHPGPDFNVLTAASLVSTGPEEAGRVLNRLAETHLITEDNRGRFGMHDLLRLFARDVCQKTDSQADRQAAEGRLVDHYMDLAQFLNSCVDPSLRPVAAQAAEQAGVTLPSMWGALAVFGAERLNLMAALDLAAQQGWDERVAQLADSTGYSLMVLRYLDDLRTVAEAALAAARRVGEASVERRALGNLGIAYTELRRFEEAIGCYQQDITICRQIGDQYGEGRTLNNLGTAYAGLRRFEEAIGCYQEALAIWRQTGDRHGEGQTLNNLGEVYRNLRRFEEAISCYLQDVTICREIGDRYGEGQTLSNLGMAYGGLRRFEETIGCFHQSLTIYRETGDRHGEGRTLNNLAMAYTELRRFDEAIGCFYQSLTIYRETGDQHSEGQTLDNLGVAYQEMRQPDRAAMCWQEAAAAMNNAGDHEEARRLQEQAADARSRRRRWWRKS